MHSGSDVFAGGDIVAFPNPLNDADVINIGHWQLASAHGILSNFPLSLSDHFCDFCVAYSCDIAIYIM